MVAPAKRKQDSFQAYYTNCNFITSYMVGLLECNNQTSVLEPCAGDGVFIDEIMRQGLNPKIKAYELNKESIEVLRNKYIQNTNVEIKNEDFLLLLALFREKYDRVIANPPYGAYQTPAKRKLLKREFPSLYAKETYGLFLARSMEMLKQSGRLVFIVPDTYLTLHMHEGLRKEIISKYTIESITTFPSNFFPGVNFGYAGLSIISILNSPPKQDQKIAVYSKLESQKDLPKLLTKEKKKYEVCQLSYNQIKRNPCYAFFLPSEKWISSVLASKAKTINYYCSVVTGFYSGNDAKHLRRSPHVTRGAKKYLSINEKEICKDTHTLSPPLDGFDNLACWVPIVKGGNRRFYKPSEWFMNWSTEAVHEYRVTNKKKARFQNSQYYFQNGIAVPMVSSSSITASLIDGRLFDQSIVGIFPKVKYTNLTYYILGFFNTEVCNKLIRTINASTNNSANYIKKIPLLIPSNELLDQITIEVERLIKLASKKQIQESELKKLNHYFNLIYGVEIAQQVN